MATLTSSLVIRLNDLVSGPARGVMASLHRLNGAAGTLSHAGSALRSIHALSIAAPGALAVSSFGHNEKEWDRAIHQYNAITEVSPANLERIKASIFDVSNATGVQSQELLDAAKGWAELGNSPDTFIENAKVAARTSRITGVTVAEQMKESSALLRAFKGSDWTQNDFKHFEEVYLVASKGMKGGAHAYGEAMKAWGPIAAGLGLTIEQASAFAQTLGGQFQPSEIGNALKTGFLRLSAPTPKSSAALRYAGINEATLYNVDKNKLDARRMAEGLRGSGLNVSKDLEAQIARDIASTDVSRGTNALVDKLRATLTQALGNKSKSGKAKLGAQDSAVVQQALLALVGNAKTSLNPEEFFRQFAPYANNLAFMSQVFGKEHAAKFMDLLKQGQHWLENYEHIMSSSEGALEKKWSIFGEGFSFEWDRVASSFENFARSVGASGIKDTFISLFQSMSGFFRRLQNADPALVRFAFWATATAAALPLVGLYLTTAGAAMSALGGAATGVVALSRALTIAPVAAAWGGLAALFGRVGGAARSAATGITLMNMASNATALSGARNAAASAAMIAGMSRARAALSSAVASAQMIEGMSAAGAMSRGGLFSGLGGIGSRIMGIVRPLRLLRGALFGLRLVMMGTGIGAALVALFAGFEFVSQNASGIMKAFSAFGDGFMKALGPAAPLVEGLGNMLGKLVDWVKQITGPIDDKKWENFGRTAGEAIGTVVGWIAQLIQKMGELAAMVVPDWLKSWIGGKLSAPSAEPMPAASTIKAAGNAVATGRDAEKRDDRADETSATSHASNEGHSDTAEESNGRGELSGVRDAARQAVDSVSDAMSQVRAIVAAVDLTEEGRRVAQSFASGIRAGISEITAAAHDMAAAAARNAARSQFSDGGMR